MLSKDRPPHPLLIALCASLSSARAGGVTACGVDIDITLGNGRHYHNTGNLSPASAAYGQSCLCITDIKAVRKR